MESSAPDKHKGNTCGHLGSTRLHFGFMPPLGLSMELAKASSAYGPVPPPSICPCFSPCFQHLFCFCRAQAVTRLLLTPRDSGSYFTSLNLYTAVGFVLFIFLTLPFFLFLIEIGTHDFGVSYFCHQSAIYRCAPPHLLYSVLETC